jgi:RNA polymerase sigma factor (sigma-70 family)
VRHAPVRMTHSAYLSDVVVRFDGWTSADHDVSRAHDELSGIMDRVRQGDVDAFASIVRTLSQPLEGYARRLTGSHDAALDLVQDVFARLWEQRAEVRVRGSVRAYLYAVLRHRAFNIRKSERAEQARWTTHAAPEMHLGMGSEPASAEEQLERDEIARRVADALAALPPRAREVALLRWRDGMSRPEIAEVMGIAVPTVNNHLTQAAQIVRALLVDLRESW